jgi:hypothetical protein
MKVGDKIIAIDECVMYDTDEPSLTIGKEYKVIKIVGNEFYIKDDLTHDHRFIFPDFDEFFVRKESFVIQMKDSLLLQADKVVNGDRNEQYGDAKQAFNEYSDILKTTFNISLSPEEICKVMMAIKLGRLKYKFKEDSLLDLMGYSEILNRLQ